MRNFPGLTRTLVLTAITMTLIACSDSSDRKDQTPSGPSAPPAMEELARQVSEANGRRAALLHISTAEGKEWSVAAGLADVAENRAANPGDQVEIGSISKFFLSPTVLRMVEEGMLSLDDPIEQWIDPAQLDELSGGFADELLLRHLLNHSTGIGDYLNFDTDESTLRTYGVDGTTVYMPQDHIDKTLELTREPVNPAFAFPAFTRENADGQSYPSYDAIPFSSYSNTGYVMLGMIIEAVSGDRYEDMIRQMVLEPLGLEDTGFGTEDAQADLTGYALGLDFSGEDPVYMSPTLSWAAGQTISTTADLTKLVKGIVEGSLFKEDATLNMWKNQYYKALNGSLPYGLGVFMLDIDGVGTVYGHEGQVFGAVALVAYDTTTGDAYSAAVNNSQYQSYKGDQPSIWELAAALRQIADDNR